MRVNEFRLPLIAHPASSTPLYSHQMGIWEGWESHSTMSLLAKTGTGKTRAAMLPVLKHREWAVAVYPTNELVKDQVRAVARFAQEEGIKSLIWTPEVWAEAKPAESYSRADHVLVPVDGALLDQWQEAMRCKSRGETLRRLLNPDKPKIVFTNPDILFLILGLQYHAEPFEALRRYETLIIGRHRPGKAIALVPPNAFQGMAALPSEVDRATFEERIYAWYPSATARPWFVTTEHGMITARALAENLLATVERDAQARPEILAKLREKIEAILADHAERLGCPTQNVQAKSAFVRCAASKQGARWLETYRRLNRFRTSLPSLRVHDFSEQHRRQDWEMGEYEVDLAMLLRRASGLAWNEKLGMLTIRGIGKYRRVHASEIFSDDDCGLILETKDFPNLLLYQDGEPTPLSDLMGRENHIFTVVPKAAVEDELDWRLPVFEAGRHLIAFDGAALMLLELWRAQGCP